MPRRRQLLLLGLLLPGVAAAQPAMAALVELNEANLAELEAVPGIGPHLAEQLIAERRRGLYSGWADLIARVKGLGPARAARLSLAGLRVAAQAWDQPKKLSTSARRAKVSASPSAISSRV
jgi:competence protein ComEA